MTKNFAIGAVSLLASLSLFSTVAHASELQLEVFGCAAGARQASSFFSVSLRTERGAVPSTELPLRGLLLAPPPSGCDSDPAKVRGKVAKLGVGRHVEVRLARFVEVEGRIREIRKDSFILAPDDAHISGPNIGTKTPYEISFSDACNVKRDVPDATKALLIGIPVGAVVLFLLFVGVGA